MLNEASRKGGVTCEPGCDIDICAGMVLGLKISLDCGNFLFSFLLRRNGCKTNGGCIRLAATSAHLHLSEGVSYFLVSCLFHKTHDCLLSVLYFSFFCSTSLALFSFSFAESQLFRDSHREINFAWPLCLWKGTQAYINIHMRLFQILSLGTELVDELFFCLIMRPVYMSLYG